MFIIMQQCFLCGILLRKYSKLKENKILIHIFSFKYFNRRYTPGGEVAVPVIVNACVHVVMYLYYGLAAMHVQRKFLSQVKLFVTVIQISQFIAAAIGCMFRFYAMFVEGDESCYDFPVLFVLIFLTHSTSLLFLFLNYFIKEYIQKSNSKEISKKKNGYIKTEKQQ